MKKAIYTLFLLFFVGMFLSGCAAKTSTTDVPKNSYYVVRKSSADGTIFLSYIFPANSDVFDGQFTENEKEVYFFYLTTYVNALAKANREKAVDGVIVGNGKYYEDIDGIGFTIMFKNLQTQKVFFGTNDADSSQTTETNISGVFIKKLSFVTQFPIATTKSANDLRTISLLAISAWAKDCNISQENQKPLIDRISQACFVYDFAVYGKGLNSDCMYEENGYSHNVFSKSFREIEENPNITFFIQEVNRGIFYIFAVIFVVCGMIISLLVIKRKNKQKKK